MPPESLDLGRRDFLTTGAAAVAGLIVGFHIPAAEAFARQAPGGPPCALPTPVEVQLKDRSAWSRIGKPAKRLDSPEKVTGRALFGQDVRFDGLKVALVERAPVFGAKVVSFDDAAARKVAGVRAVVQVPSGVAVVADHFYAAREGRRALAPTIKWDLGAGGALDTGALRAQYREMAQRPGAKAGAKGDAAAEKAGWGTPVAAGRARAAWPCTRRSGASWRRWPRCRLPVRRFACTAS